MVFIPKRLDRLPDEALLTALGLSDTDAAAVFVRRFQTRVYGLAYLITHDRSSAEDVAQQVFERAWRHAASFDARRGSVATWLLVITRNLAIDTIRIRKPDAIDPAELIAYVPATLTNEAEDSAIQSDELARLRPALDRLPPEQRRAVLLATLAGRTAVEIADIENIPVPTAKTRLRAGLNKLQIALVREETRS